MEYLTKVEVIKETGVTNCQVRFYIETGYFKDTKCENNRWYISINDVQKLKEDLQFRNDSYSLKEVCTLLGYNSVDHLISKFKEMFKDDFRLVFDKYYIRKNVFDKYIESLPELNLIKSGEYISSADIDKLGISEIGAINNHYSYISHLAMKGRFKGAIQHPLSQKWYFPKDEVISFIKKPEYLQNSYTLEEICNLLGMSCDTVKSSYTKAIYLLFPNHESFKKRIYFEKTQVDNFIKEFSTKKTPIYSILKSLQGSPIKRHTFKRQKEKIVKNKPIKKQLDEFIIQDNKKYIHVDNVAKLLNTKRAIILNSIKRNKFNDVFLYENNYWILEDEVNKIKELLNNSTEFINLPSMGILAKNQLLNMRNRHAIPKYFPNVFVFDIFGQSKTRIPYSDIENFKLKHTIEIQKKEEIKNETNPKKLYQLLLEDYNNTPFVLTLNWYNSFAVSKINSTKANDMRYFAFNLANSIIRLMNEQKKEIHLYTDNELLELLKSPSFTSAHKLYIAMFLMECKKKHKDLCKFKDDYNRYINNTEGSIRKGSIYSLEKWNKYFSYVTNIDMHIIKAFENSYYAKMWLYTILHFSVAWRREDILSIPALNLDSIDKYTFEWFKNNTFLLSDGQTVINAMKLIISTKRTGKTDARTHFVIPFVLIIPTAIAFLIAEQHRRVKKEYSIFGRSKFFKSDFDKFFDDEDLKDFSNLKACRSFITYSYNNATNKEGMAQLAYTFGSYLRSHMADDKIQLAPSTALYIYSTGLSGDSSNVAYNLFKRGYFGFIYYLILRLAKNTDNLSVDEVTDQIMNMKKEYTPMGLEAFSSYMLNEYNEIKSVVTELITKPSDEIKDISLALSRGEMPSKTDDIQCLQYKGNIHKCPYYFSNNNCLWCKYKIPTNYALSILKVELLESLENLENTEDTDYISRQKHTSLIIKLLSILSEAKLHFDKWDKNYISSFIDLEELNKRVKILEDNKFLILE